MLQAATGYPVESILLQVETDPATSKTTPPGGGASSAPKGIELPNADELEMYAGKNFVGDFGVDMR